MRRRDVSACVRILAATFFWIGPELAKRILRGESRRLSEQRGFCRRRIEPGFMAFVDLSRGDQLACVTAGLSRRASRKTRGEPKVRLIS